MIEYYNTRLTERERRRQFVMDRKLINVRKQQNLDRRRNPAETELYARLKAIARYLPQHEFEVLSDGIITEARLRARIQVCSGTTCWPQISHSTTHRQCRFPEHVHMIVRMIGTSDQSCWLAEACKVLLLLLPCAA